jgi:hypothetical protein
MPVGEYFQLKLTRAQFVIEKLDENPLWPSNL